jgi:FtsH-binding integral membrane protein
MKLLPLKKIFEMILVKKEFLALVFVNLFFQLGITYVIMERTTDAKKKYNFWLLFFAIIAILIILIIPMHPILKFALFCVFSYIFGILLSVIKEKHNEEQIKIAIQSALSVFGAMILTALGLLVGGIRLGYKFGIFLFFALLALIIIRLINLFNNSFNKQILSIIGTILFSLYVLYDTHVILNRNYNGDFIHASMAYYLDITNLFTNILRSEE